MKRLLALLITLVMILCLGACGGNAKDVTETEDSHDPGIIEEENEENEENNEENDSNETVESYTLLYLQSGPLALACDNRGENELVGAFDSSGKLVIPCKYDSLEYIGRDRYLICKSDDDDNCRYGIADLKGNEIVPCEYESIEPVKENVISCYLEGNREPEGEYVTAKKEGSDNDEYISIIDGKSVSKIDKSKRLTFGKNSGGTFHGDYIIPVPEKISKKYKESWGIPYGSNECTFYEGVQCHYYAVTDKNGELGIVDARGHELGNGARWAQAGFEYGNGLIAVRKDDDGLWALIDSEGNEVTDYIFDVELDNA